MKALLKQGVVWLMLLSFAAQAKQVDYSIEQADFQFSGKQQLPNISKYNADYFEQRKQRWRQLPQGKVLKKHIRGQVEMRLLYGGEHFMEMAAAQQSVPHSLTLEGGIVTLAQIHQAFPDYFLKLEQGKYLSLLPIVISISAALVIEQESLLLSQEKNAFLVNGGKLVTDQAEIIGWSETQQQAAVFDGDESKFRPFLITWGGSDTDLYRTLFKSLGYNSTKSFGISLSSYHVKDEPMFQVAGFDFHARPRATIVNNQFDDIYYGFYCYKADDVILIGNEYIDNVIYGIDPHDYSNRLVIANNVVHGTKVKHGIIISREVKHSFIFNNTVFNNKGAGIMLDRMSEHNIVANNLVYQNGGNGISIYESNHNLIVGNQFLNNRSHGMRIRNSDDIYMIDNQSMNNKGYGVFSNVQDLASHTHRNLVIDPYQQVSSFAIEGGVIAYNRTGSIYMQDNHLMRLGPIDFYRNGNKKGALFFGGDLTAYHQQLMQSYLKQQKISLINESLF